MYTLCVANQKGGVGKTTTAINLGAALASKGLRVLLIDFDPQGHLTEGLGVRDKYLTASPNIYELLLGEVKATLSELEVKAESEELLIIPSHIKLFLAEQGLTMQRGREFKLRRLVEEIQHEFDWILIDCPPSLGLLTDNAIYASRRVLVPIQAEDTSIRALEILLDQVQSLEQALGIEVEILGVLPNMVEDTKLAKGILKSLRESLPLTFPFEIRKRVKLKEAWAQGQSIFRYDPRSDLIPVYTKLAEELIKKVER
jgi:chromosome partitioning protein